MAQLSRYRSYSCYTADRYLFLVVTNTASPASVSLRDLRLATAHALVAQSLGSEVSLQGQTPLLYLQNLIDGLCELSLKDPLTGLANRRHVRAVLEREIDRVARSGEAALLLILDIDHFKQVNDRHGHLAGDAVLRHVAGVLQQRVRAQDIVGRYGGEEFLVVLPDTGLDGAQHLALQLCRAVQTTPCVWRSETIAVTVSIGVFGGRLEPQDHWDLLLHAADSALYRAKEGGRNRVEVAPRVSHVQHSEMETGAGFEPTFPPSV